jgi:monoamine oxidase
VRRVFHVRDGYDRIPEALSRRLERLGGTLLLNRNVRTLTWSEGDVSLDADEPAGAQCTLHAARAVITLPLGVLQAGCVSFVPEPLQRRTRSSQDPDALLEVYLRSLSAAFGMSEQAPAPRLRSWHTHDWTSDPHALGAYSYAPAGAVDASEEMTVPVAGTLYFAGEHTDTTGHWGTVHGALRSGMRAAAQILRRA